MSTPVDETAVQTVVTPVDQTLVQPAVAAQPPDQPKAGGPGASEPPSIDWGDLSMIVVFAVAFGIMLIMTIGVIAAAKEDSVFALFVGVALCAALAGLVFYSLSLINQVKRALRRRS